ncbi:ribose 5-phosphate isomerase B [bacterium]|mgnify:CR=1 FL=1|jgi:ribose 5-phosphate isomerase B|nr:ribose 5-phosphate isomerase B [bacterium]
MKLKLNNLSIGIASDHGALNLKQTIIDHLKNKADLYSAIDLGAHSNESVDYPDYAQIVSDKILDKTLDLGILCCGTGIGMSIKANRNKGIRAALVFSSFTAQMAKEHNNANVLCLGERTTSIPDALSYLDTWLESKFEGGRHQRRLDKLDS